MTHILSLGAINKQTGEYVYPKIANKKDEYVCPDCNKDLILCQGEIIRPYFRHKVDSVNPCHHYSNPTETQIHKDGKMVMKSLLERKTPISFIRNCCSCKKNEEHEIPEMTESSKIELEYRFEYNGTKIADVVYIDNDDILCIFEICNTHKTCSENRPEPWFEIDAETLIKLANDNALHHIKIPCIRCEKCDDCIEKEKITIEKEKEQVYNKNKAVDIVYDWLKDGNIIKPFIISNEDFEFGKIQKYVRRDDTNEIYDIIIYEKFKDDDNTHCESYYIKLMYETIYACFTKEECDVVEIGLLSSIKYIDINWVLSQTIQPTQIYCIAEICRYIDDDIYCSKCDAFAPFYVKRTNICNQNYKVINVGCFDCKYNANTEFATCFRCKKNTEINVMETNKVSNLICKNCDIYLYDKTLLNVPYAEKDEVKKYGACFDNLCKKWYVKNNNKDINIILSKWKKQTPDQSNTKHPY